MNRWADKDVACIYNGMKRMKNENLLSAATPMLLEGIMLTETQILYLIPYMCNLTATEKKTHR